MSLHTSRNDQKTHASRISLFVNTIIVLLASLIYYLARLHVSENSALLLSAIPLVLGAVVEVRYQHPINAFVLFSLLNVTVQLICNLAFPGSRILFLLENSLVIGVYGISFLGSFLFGKPLLLGLLKSAVMGSSFAHSKRFTRWQTAEYRSLFTFLTAFWGIGLLLELGISVLLVFLLPSEKFLLINRLITCCFFGIWILLTIRFFRTFRSTA